MLKNIKKPIFLSYREISESLPINPQTGKSYSRQHIELVHKGERKNWLLEKLINSCIEKYINKVRKLNAKQSAQMEAA